MPAKTQVVQQPSLEERAAAVMQTLNREDLFALYSVCNSKKQMIEALCNLEEKSPEKNTVPRAR